MTAKPSKKIFETLHFNRPGSREIIYSVLD